jgi:hypothetical protein
MVPCLVRIVHFFRMSGKSVLTVAGVYISDRGFAGAAVTSIRRTIHHTPDSLGTLALHVGSDGASSGTVSPIASLPHELNNCQNSPEGIWLGKLLELLPFRL